MKNRAPRFVSCVRFASLGVIVALVLGRQTSVAATSEFAPPAGFVDTPSPDTASTGHLVSRTEEIVIDRPLSMVLGVVDRPLKEAIRGTSSLPGVAGSYVLTKGEFGGPGSRRLNFLTDNSTLVEQVLDNERTAVLSRFRYVVWNYTSEVARPINFGIGDFRYDDIGSGRTRIKWTYSFELNRRRFPGCLGSFGDFLFRVAFLDRQYAAMMRGVLLGYKTEAERVPVTEIRIKKS